MSSYRDLQPRVVILACAIALSMALVSPAAAKGDPRTCAYRDARLAEACRTDSDIHAYLLDPENAGIESYMDVPPVYRGWEPGEEEGLIGALREQAAADAPRSNPGPPSYPSGSPMAVMGLLEAQASGAYARQVEAERARTPRVNWSAAQIRAAGRRAVLDELRDPTSAQFRNVRRLDPINGTTTFCGEVNARNAFGGYSGFKRFESGVTNRGAASAQVDGQDGMVGAYFNSAWNQFCGRIAGTSAQF